MKYKFVTESSTQIFLRSIGYTTILFILTLPVLLIYYSVPLLRVNSVFDILFSKWNPDNAVYGLGVFTFTTLLIGLFSTFLSFFLGLAISLFIYRYKNRFIGKFLKRLVQTMSGIPTVVYGFVGLILLVPLIREYTASPTGLCLLTVIVTLSIVILPTIVLYIVSSFEMVSKETISASLALGATKEQLYFYVLLPQAMRGIVISLILGFSRSISDTMIALMLSGNSLQFPDTVFKSARNLTSQIALILPGEFHGTAFKSIFFSALILIAFIFVFNLLIRLLERKDRRNHG